MRIFISHMHGDHMFGLPGMLHSLAFMGRTRDLEIFGPTGICEFIEAVNRVVGLNAQFRIFVKEIQGGGRVVAGREYEVRAAPVKHGVCCYAYAFEELPHPGKFNPKKALALGIPEGPLWRKLQTSSYVKVDGRRIASKLVVGPKRPGVKVTYAVDTRPCQAVVRLAEGSDLLIHDSTFDQSAASKARAYGHSTSVEAAQVAVKSKSRRLALFHISAMYEDATSLLSQARKVFRQSFLTEDMDTVYVSRRKRSNPP
jgi:ribonuclease Z